VFTAAMAEALALKGVLQKLISLNLSNVIIEIDVKATVDDLVSAHTDNTEFGLLL
jgi:hypothetical protein